MSTSAFENHVTLSPEGIPEISPDTAGTILAACAIIDVRRPDEFNAELGHIKGAELITLGPDLEKFLRGADKQKSYLFVCRSGMRSAQATAVALSLGLRGSANLKGGMMLWSASGLAVERA